jgi:hypothetical protein
VLTYNNVTIIYAKLLLGIFVLIVAITATFQNFKVLINPKEDTIKGKYWLLVLFALGVVFGVYIIVSTILKIKAIPL